MCIFVVQLKEAMLNGLDPLFSLTFVLCAPVSKVALDCDSHFIKSLKLPVPLTRYTTPCSLWSTQVCRIVQIWRNEGENVGGVK